MQKIFILTTDSKNTDKFKVADTLASIYDLTVGKAFTNSDDVSEHQYSMKSDEILIAFKNNALLYCDTNSESISEGITADEYYNNDIFCLSLRAFNNISESLLGNVLLVWMDSAKKDVSADDVINTKYFIENLDSFPYLYFNDDAHTVISVLRKYIDGPEKVKKALLEEYS